MQQGIDTDNHLYRPHDPKRPRFTVFSAAGAAALAVALVLLSVFALNLNLGRLKDSFGWVEHTNEVLLQLADIDDSLIDGESGERGYLLTGNEAYRATYEHARDTIGGQMDALTRLLSDNPAQVQRLRTLRTLIDSRFDEFKQAVAFGPDRLADALAILKTARAEQLTPTIREGLAQLRQNELALLDQRQRRAAQDAGLANLLAIAAGVLALASLALGLFLFQRQRSRYRIRQLQSELIHVSRLNTMGQTASILAHEVKQPLTATTNYIQGARRMVEASEPPPPAKIAEVLGKAHAQVVRAAQIVSRLRGFVDKGGTERTAADIGTTIDEAISLIELGRGNVALRRNVDPLLPSAVIDKVQIQQVLINLMRNAGEAMQESERREIAVSARALDGMIEIAVEDTGPGLPHEVADRLFQPFVSTKQDGMGVGLSICRAIIETHGGRIWAEASPAGGTVFHFTVPTVH
jgi:two-component system, LuxR family, sensor kinase FixL